jgi:hypothetical protein
MTLQTAQRATPSTPSPSTAGAPVVPYVSRFRQDLGRSRWAALAVLIVWALCWFSALRAADVATRVIGHDTAPSISAAERIRTLLSDANGNLANIMLISQADPSAFVAAFRTDVSDAEQKLVEAAENITYGDAERVPIVTIMFGVAEYEQLVGQARALGSVPIALKADDLMRNTILPSTEALDKANDDQLTAQYQDYLNSKWRLHGLAWLTSLVALAALGFIQFMIFRNAKRLVNPGLAAASLVVAAFSLFAIAALAASDAELKTAKSDAFDSIYALTTLQAVANDANATESYWLLGYDDPAKRKAYEDLFKSLSREIVGIDLKEANAAEGARRKFPGLLGDELSNITFEGELEAAEATLKAWGVYVAIDGQLRALQISGKHTDAVALDVGLKPGQSDWAFDQFQKALVRTIQINQDAFDAAIRGSERRINLFVYGALLIAWLAASGAAWHGLRQRLREYEF